MPFNVTIRTAIEAMKGVDAPGEIVVCDNSDKEFREYAVSMIPRQYIKNKTVRLCYLDDPCFTAARMMAANWANGEYLFCVDSHVMFGRDVLKDSVEFMDSMKGTPVGFAHPPINWAGQGEGAKRHSWELRKTPRGHWGYKVDKACKIPGKYMPWICNRNWYISNLKGYGCLAEKMVSWGGAEMLQQHKSWMLGYQNWAIPTDPIIHIGPFSRLANNDAFDYKYRVYGDSGQYPVGIGWLVAYYVLGGEDARYYIVDHEASAVNPKLNISIDKHWDTAVEIGKEEREWMLKNQMMSLWEMLEVKPWLS